MITTIQFPTTRTNQRSGPRGFTLVEVLISMSLASIILAGVFSSFLFIGRSGIRMQNYNEMEAQSRRALEMFAEDVRQASDITWDPTTNKSFTVKVNFQDIVYSVNTGTGIFQRRDAVGTRTLITGITAGSFSFKAFDVNGTALPLDTAVQRAAANVSTKQVQLSLETTRARTSVATATNLVLSARFILRNKPVTA